MERIDELSSEELASSSFGSFAFPQKKIPKDEKDKMMFYKILNKIPDDLRVYVQDKVFKQFEETMSEYEKWKRETLRDGNNPELPDVNVDNQVPLDDIYEDKKAKEY